MNAVRLSRLMMVIIFSEDLDPNIVLIRTILFAMITSTASDILKNCLSVQQTILQHF